MGDVARKVMGDVPISYIEGIGGTRVSEDDIVAVGKHDVSFYLTTYSTQRLCLILIDSLTDPILQGWSVKCECYT